MGPLGGLVELALEAPPAAATSGVLNGDVILGGWAVGGDTIERESGVRAWGIAEEEGVAVDVGGGGACCG